MNWIGWKDELKGDHFLPLYIAAFEKLFYKHKFLSYLYTFKNTVDP